MGDGDSLKHEVVFTGSLGYGLGSGWKVIQWTKTRKRTVCMASELIPVLVRELMSHPAYKVPRLVNIAAPFASSGWSGCLPRASTDAYDNQQLVFNATTDAYVN
jgi:hypothetical protein